MEHVYTFGISSINVKNTPSEGTSFMTPKTGDEKDLLGNLAISPSMKTLVSPVYRPLFQDFSRLHTKTLFLTQRDLYIKQLTCILMVTAEKALAISQIYPTLSHLLEAYEKLPPHPPSMQRPLLLKDVVVDGATKLGEKLSTRIYEILYGIQ